jgi:hypothetical protein
MLAPTPFNTERRETCFLDKYMASLPHPTIPRYRSNPPHRGRSPYWPALATRGPFAAGGGTLRILN